MSVDQRTRFGSQIEALSFAEAADRLSSAVDVNSEVAHRGAIALNLDSLGFRFGDYSVGLRGSKGRLQLTSDLEDLSCVVALDGNAMSDLVQDVASTMGLVMRSRAKIVKGSLDEFLSWEPVLRALLDGRQVYEPGDITFGSHSRGIDLSRSFGLDDDLEEIGEFLEVAGFVHLRGVFEPDEMAVIAADLDYWLGLASPDDGESWWATDGDGLNQPVRVLNFQEKSDHLAHLLCDTRMELVGRLTDDQHLSGGGAEGLRKPLNIVRGLSDLPWHKDCGQGMHSYRCSSLTVGISVTGADRDSGALGVIAGSHRANVNPAMLEPRLDLPKILLETEVGDLTVHCSDTLHRAYPPVARSRSVVYTSFELGQRPGEGQPVGGGYFKQSGAETRAARASLSNTQDRLDSAVSP